jgi:hypothetical protein
MSGYLVSLIEDLELANRHVQPPSFRLFFLSRACLLSYFELVAHLKIFYVFVGPLAVR